MTDRNPSTNPFPVYVSIREAVFLRPEIGAWLVAPEYPPGMLPLDAPVSTEGSMPLTFWNGTHPVCSRWFPLDVAWELEWGAMFRKDLHLVFWADCEPGAEVGQVRVRVLAVPWGTSHFDSLLEADRRLGGALPLTDAGHSRLGLEIGTTWVSVPVGLLSPRSPEFDEERMRQLAPLCDEAFDRILWGEPGQIAAGLLESIEGISGEVEGH
jgi:hypothetical protein